ncbi:hypothetical protein Bca101_064006 [Brassica carinata]
MYGFEALTFNIHGGYLEAIVRGHRAGLLTTADYNNLCQCENLDDIKMHLSATKYGPYLQNEPSPLHTTTIVEKCTLKLVDDYKHMLCQATEPMSTFLEYIRYGHMIDNVVLIVTGTLHERDVQELIEKCHPLGMFDSIATLAVAQNMRELYRLVLVDTPLAPYFSECLTSEDLDDMNIEIMRNTLYKAYLEDFYKFCQKLGGATSEIMSDLLAFEADRRAVNITINSIGTELTREDRKKLYSNFGLLYPYGHEELAICEDIDQVRGVMEKYPPYQAIFSKMSYGESQMLDKAFYEEEVRRLCLAFEQQFHYGVFFAYMRLREQEIRNLMWISECVAQNQKSRIHDSRLAEKTTSSRKEENCKGKSKEVALTEKGVVNERLPLRLFATDRYPRKRHNCNSLLSTFFCLEMCLKILKKLPQHTRLVLSEMLDVEHDLQAWMQLMMERGEDKEDGWGEFDCEIFDRKAAYMVELIKGDINSKNGSGEAVIQLSRSISTKKLKKARKGMR